MSGDRYFRYLNGQRVLVDTHFSKIDSDWLAEYKCCEINQSEIQLGMQLTSGGSCAETTASNQVYYIQKCFM